MKPRIGRTGVAALLVGMAVAAPCAAWYFAGLSAARQQGERLRDQPLRQAQVQADRLAHQVALRLESLRESESRRPHSDYETDFDMTQSDCSTELRLVSPLAEGPTDPVVWTHFQIDDVGRLSLPTVDASADAVQQAILDELECASAVELAAQQSQDVPAETRLVASPEGVVTVSPFSWSASTVKQQPALLALREVATPQAVVTQGFVVLADAMESQFGDAGMPAQVRQGSLAGPGEAAVPLSAYSWLVSVDASDALIEAEAEANAVIARFRRNFLLGAIGAVLAGVAVILLVARTEQLARDRARFAASAAHELRTPLAGMQLYGEMLSEGLGDPSRTVTYARRIAEEAERLGRVVTNVLGFTQLERDELSVNVEPGDLSLATRRSLERLRPLLEAHGMRIEASIADRLPPTRFDADALHQILQNLLDNAEKYTRNADDRTVRVELVNGSEGAVLSVVDAGSGVVPALRGKLFRPFTRGRDDDAPDGLGVGLALVRALAQAQGAEVSHGDARDGGSVFSIRFPTAA